MRQRKIYKKTKLTTKRTLHTKPKKSKINLIK